MNTQTDKAAPPLGAFPTEQGTLFRLWSDTARTARVVLFTDRQPPVSLPLTPLPDGVFELDLQEARPGSRYRCELDGEEVADPYARWLPEGVFAPAEDWGSGTAPRPAGPVVETYELVICELHLGTFTPEGTVRAAITTRQGLRDLGVTCLELPLSSFPGRWGWGCDGVATFAPDAASGGPDDLMAFIDAAHEVGLPVLLDLVLNHLGPDGKALGRYSGQSYTRQHHTPWGDALNDSRPWTQQLPLDCVEHWLGRYRSGGLRLDATHEIFDDSRTHILDELAARVRSIGEERGERTYLYAEDDRNAAHLVAHTGLDGVWADDFHPQLRLLLTGEQDGYDRAYRPEVQALARCIRRGQLYGGQPWPFGAQDPRGESADRLPASALVSCLQHHDQIGNRALGDRIQGRSGMQGFALLLFLPMTPLVFQGQEWMASTPAPYYSDHHGDLGRLITGGYQREFAPFGAFNAPCEEWVPVPQGEQSCSVSKFVRAEREQGVHRQAVGLYRALLELRRQAPVLRGGRRHLEPGVRGGVLWVKRWAGPEARLLLNLTGLRVDVAGLLGAERRALIRTRPFEGDAGLPGRSAGIVAVPAPWTADWEAPLDEAPARVMTARAP